MSKVNKSKILIQELNISSANRGVNDIGTFKTALLGAENIYFPNRTMLYDLYESGLIDSHLSGLVNKRLAFVLNKELHYYNKDGVRVKEFDRVIRSNTFLEIITKVLETKLWGITGFEFIPGGLIEFKEIPRKHIKPHKQVISIEQSNDEGVLYDDISNVWVIGEKDDLGLLHRCMTYIIWKMGAMADWAQYIEIYGQPVRVAYYDAYDIKTKFELRKVLEESGSSLCLMIPKQVQFEIVDGKESNGNGQLQEEFIRYCDTQMSVLILGNTETTVSSKNSGQAQSQEHAKQQLEKTKSDLIYVQGYLNNTKFKRILKTYGLPVDDEGSFQFSKDVDLGALKTKIEIEAIVMQGHSVPVSDDYVYKTYGIPKPDNYAELKAKQEADRLSSCAHGIEDTLDQEEQDRALSLMTLLVQSKALVWNKIIDMFQPKKKAG